MRGSRRHDRHVDAWLPHCRRRAVHCRWRRSHGRVRPPSRSRRRRPPSRSPHRTIAATAAAAFAAPCAAWFARSRAAGSLRNSCDPATDPCRGSAASSAPAGAARRGPGRGRDSRCARWRRRRPCCRTCRGSPGRRTARRAGWPRCARSCLLLDLAVAVDGVVLVDVDVDVATAPVAAAPDRADGRHADAERDARGQRPAGVVVRRRRVVVRRVRRVRPGAVHHRRVVGRHVHRLGLRRLDLDHRLLRRRSCSTITFCCSLLFRLPACCAFVRSRCTASSTSFDDARNASPSFCTQSGCVAHHLEDLRERRQRLHARVPGLVLHRLDRRVALAVRVRLRPTWRRRPRRPDRWTPSAPATAASRGTARSAPATARVAPCWPGRCGRCRGCCRRRRGRRRRGVCPCANGAISAIKKAMRQNCQRVGRDASGSAD